MGVFKFIKSTFEKVFKRNRDDDVYTETSQSTPFIITPYKKADPLVFTMSDDVKDKLLYENKKEDITVYSKKVDSDRSVSTPAILPQKIGTETVDVKVLKKSTEGEWNPGELFQYAPRGILSAGLQLTGKKVYTPTTNFERGLFGDRLIFNSKLTGAAALADIGIGQGLDIKSYNELPTGFKGAGVLAVGLAINVLDASDIYIGGGKSAAIKAISKSDDIVDIAKNLKKIVGKEMDEEILNFAAKELVNVKSTKEVEDYIFKLTGVNDILNAKREARILELGNKTDLPPAVNKEIIDNTLSIKNGTFSPMPVVDEAGNVVKESKAPKLNEYLKNAYGNQLDDNVIKTYSNAIKNSKTDDEVITILNNMRDDAIKSNPEYIGSINVDNLNLTPEGKKAFKNQYEQVRKELEVMKGSPMSAKEVNDAMQEASVLQKAMTKAESLELTATIKNTRNRINALEEALFNTTDPIARQELMSELFDNITNLDTTANWWGRLGQAFKGKSEGDLSVIENVLRRIKKSGADLDAVKDRMKTVDFSDGNSVDKFYREFVKPTFNEVLMEYRYNNLLSNPRSHMRNFATNTLNSLFIRPATRTVEAGLDAFSSALTGKPREIFFKEVPEYYRKAFSGLREAIKDVGNVMSGKSSMTNLDFNRVPTGVLPKVYRLPTLAMEAGDKFFSRLVFEGEKAALLKRGYSQAKAIKEASKAAEYSLFRSAIDVKNKSGQGHLLSGIDKYTSIIDSFRKTGIGNWIVPFLRTPMNIAKQMIEYSPAGVFTMAGAANKKQQLAKAFIGSTISAWAAMKAWDGETTWGVPTDPEAKEAFFASGRKPYSFKVNDKWIPMIYAGPLAFAMAIPAAMKYQYEDNPKRFDNDWAEKGGIGLLNSIEIWTQQTYLESLSNFIDIFKAKDGKEFGNAAGFTSTQAIPMSGLLRYVSQIVDPYFRKTDTWLDQIKLGIPYWSKELDAYQTPGAPGFSGQPSKRNKINLLMPWDIGQEKLEYSNLLNQRNDELDINAFLAKNDKDFDKKANDMILKIGDLLEKGTQEELDEIAKELNDNKALANTVSNKIKKMANIEAAMLIPHFIFRDPKFTAESIYFRTQLPDNQSPEAWQENVVDFIEMLQNNGLITDDVIRNLSDLILRENLQDNVSKNIPDEDLDPDIEDFDWNVNVNYE